MYPDAYAHLYQKMEGFKICVKQKDGKLLKGYLSAKQSTRSTYDMAMRDATIDGLITMDKIEELKPSAIFFREINQYDEQEQKEKYKTIYNDLIGFVSMVNRDEKNFAAGVEDTTNINIQIPKRDINEEIYLIENQDRIILSNLKKDMSKQIKVESIDAFGVPGVIRIYGTFDTRSGD